jgi:hypothetical protein
MLYEYNIYASKSEHTYTKAEIQNGDILGKAITLACGAV